MTTESVQKKDRALLGRNRWFGALSGAASLAALLLLSAPPATACCDNSGSVLREMDLPDSARVQFRGESGPTFYPKRLLLVGPNRGVMATLPRRSALFDENILPLRKAPGIGGAFQRAPIIDQIGPGATIGALYRSGDALVAVFESEGAYRDAVWRLNSPVGLVTRLSRGRGLASMRLGLDFQPLSRSAAPRSGLQGPIGAVHGIGPMLALTPPRRSLPRNNIF